LRVCWYPLDQAYEPVTIQASNFRARAIRLMTNLIKRVLSIPWLAEGAALTLGAAYLFQAVRYAHLTGSVLDEGAYLFKGYLFASGRYVPFQDYGPWTNHMPFSFLIPGAIQVLLGPGLRTGRYFAVAIGVLMLVGVWLVSRRVGGRWWAVFAVAALALNPALLQYYSIGVSQGLTACMLTWTMALTLGKDRAMWQLGLGAALAGLTVMTRENMLPLLPLLVLYIFWQHGWRAGLLAVLAGGATLAGGHALFWPRILRIWAGWLPRNLTPFLNAVRARGGGAEVWDPNPPSGSRLLSLTTGLRLNFVALVGLIGFSLLGLFRRLWKSAFNWRDVVFLSILLWTLALAHAWASLGLDYCVYCFSGYLAFFYPLGVILVILVNRGLASSLRRSYTWLASGVILLVSTLVGFGAFKTAGKALLELPLPRVKEGQVLGGSAPLWALLQGVFGLEYDPASRLVSTLAGAAFGVLFLLAMWGLSRSRLVRPSYQRGFGFLALNAFIICGLMLSPTALMASAELNPDCRNDFIASYEAVGRYLAEVIPAGARIYWNGGLSVVPLLYVPGVEIYPPQINDGYSYRVGGDADQLFRSGRWNDELRDRWMNEADFIILEEWRYHQGWKRFLESGQFDELARSPAVDVCSKGTALRIFRRKSN